MGFIWCQTTKLTLKYENLSVIGSMELKVQAQIDYMLTLQPNQPSTLDKRKLIQKKSKSYFHRKCVSQGPLTI